MVGLSVGFVSQKRALSLLILFCVLVPGAAADDWTELRGPNRDGVSAESGLPDSWSLDGDNLLWRVPYGGLSGPVVLGDRVYLQNSVGEGATIQERVLSFDADSGELLWEQRLNITHSDAPSHRAGWATPGLDAETGNVYIITADATLAAYSREGDPVWRRQLTEEFGFLTTHGGRVTSPMVDGDFVIVAGITFNWGEFAGGGQRFMTFDKRTGETVWVSSPGQRPYDTTYSPPMITEIDGVRLIVAGGSDGAWYAIRASTGERVWRYAVSKRGLNTGAIRVGDNLILSHSEENLETSTMGFRASLDLRSAGEVTDSDTNWLHRGFLAGYASPVTDGERIYQVDNGAMLGAFDIDTGEELWSLKLGTIQKAALVYADGKLYVGTANSKFYILRPGPDGCEILSEVEVGNPDNPEQVTAGAAVSNGRVYFSTAQALYAIGSPDSQAPTWTPHAPARATTTAGAPATMLVVPGDVTVSPGESVDFHVRLFDAKGNYAGESEAEWSLDSLGGAISPDGTYTALDEAQGFAGKVRATAGGISGEARVRVIPPLDWGTNFDDFDVGGLPAWWLNTRLKYSVTELDGNKVFTKRADNPFSFIRRARTYGGQHTASNYTTEAELRFAMRRRTMGDGGIVAQGYQLVIFGNHQRLELHSWQPETERTVTAPMRIDADTWYHMKLEVQTLSDGSVRARGKAWPNSESEPADWTLERIDPPGLGILTGAPGLYGDGRNEIYFDNFKVTPSR